MKLSLSAMGCAALLASQASFGQPAPPPASPPPMPPGIIGAPSGTGAYPAVAEVVASLPANTVYHPAKLPPSKMPVVLWGNGACKDNGLGNARFLREIASHGYLVIAAGHARQEDPMRPAMPPSTKPTLPAGAPGTPGPIGPDETQSSQLTDGLNWATAQNSDRTSHYFHRLDLHHVAVMGHSCGGLQAIQVAADPRITTAVIWNSGVYISGPNTGRSRIAVTKDQLKLIHTPIAYIDGGPSDIAYLNGRDDFERINQVPVFFGWIPVGHGGTFYSAPNGGEYGKVAVAWLDWQLKGDRKAGAMFAGPKCGLCTDPRWTVARKGLDRL